MTTVSAPRRYAHVNGTLVPENEATISIRDRGFIYGDCVFDTARTFNGTGFRLQEHVDRLFESLTYARIDCGRSPAEVLAATEALIEANRPALRDGEDYWVTQRVSPGQAALDGEDMESPGPTLVIDCVPLPLRARARFFRDGIEAAVSPRRRIPPEALSPATKSNNYLNMMLAQRELEAVAPGRWAVMCDKNGNLAEGPGANLFIVKDGVVMTPTTEFILDGVSRQVVLDLCRKLDIPAVERDISLHAAMTADEGFFTSTSLCACPLRALNGFDLPGGVPGPVTKRIMDAFSELVGMDYVAQYLRFLSNAGPSTGL